MNFPPVIEGGNFIFGQFGRNLKDPINFIQENQKKYGNVFIMQGIFELFRTNYVLSEEGINMVLKAPEEKFNFRNGIRKFIRAVFGEYKEVPREEELDWNKRVIQGIKRSQKINQESINFSLKEILPKYSEKGQFEFDEMIEELVYKINICSMLGRDALKDFEEIKTCLSGVEHYGFQPLSMLFPYAPFGTSKKTRELKKRAIEIFGDYIQKRRQSNESIDDYLSIWAQSPHVAGEDKGKDYTDEEITNRIINITIAAHVNTAVTLEHVLIKIFQNKEYLQRVREEVRELENQEKDVTSSVLVSNAIKEVMRISNAGSFMRRIEEDTMFEGYLLEKGTMIATSAAHIHFSPEIFPDPYSFKPDRWEDSNLNKYAYWFGMGTHRCKGDQYALQILKSVVVDIAKKWELEFHNKNTEDFEVDWTKNRKPKGKIIASLKSSKN